MEKKKGFTLIEVMIAVAIIAILTAIITPQFSDLIKKSKETKLKENLNILRNAVDIAFTKNNGKYPEEISVDMFKEKKIPEDIIKDTNQIYYNYDEEIIVNSDEGGWIYNPILGEVRVNNNEKDLNGKPYSSY